MGFHHDVWMVRIDGTFAQAQVYDGSDRQWEMDVDSGTRPWLTFRHERVSPIFSSSWTNDRLVIMHGDERGPSITKMAALIPDPIERARWSLEQVASVAEALATAAWREKGFVHRRAVPEQMFVGPDGNARLRSLVAFVKWGKIGTYTGRSNTFTASINYMAPEQARGIPSTPQTDVHSLASTVYGCLAGRAPWSRDDQFKTLQAIADAEPLPPPPGASPALADLLARSLAKDPSQRPRDAATFAAELRRCIVEPLPPDLLARVAALRPNKHPAPHQSDLIVGYRCPKKWDELSPTHTDGVRHCESCKHDVVEVRSLHAMIPLMGQRCVSLKPDDGN